MTRKRVCIVTSTRADWGLLTPLAEALRASAWAELSIVATNTHLDARYGMTVSEIEDAGFAVTARVAMDAAGDDGVSRAHATAQCLAGMADAFARINPDCVVILGDRYEMLGVATAATLMRIPIVHIAGGTVSRGAIDDNVRHALTKLSALHLVETEANRQRVLQMGETPERVFATGALGVWNIMHRKLLSAAELAETLDGFSLDRTSSLLVTYHPATLDPADQTDRFDRLLDALDSFPESKVLITYPNNDAGGAAIAARVEDYAHANPQRVKAVKSLGMLRYLSALRCVAAVVGNSSSGIVEVPSMHIPTVDIGIRQDGRERAASVLHCGPYAEDIAECIATALSPSGQSMAKRAVNPYYREDTVEVMMHAIHDFLQNPTPAKVFNDMKF